MTKDELIEARASKLEELKAINNKDEFDQKAYDKVRNEIDKISAQIDTLELDTKLEETQEKFLGFGDDKKMKDKELEQSFISYLKTGSIQDPQNAITLDGAEGAAHLVPQEWADEIIKKLNKNVAVRRFAHTRKTKGTFNMPMVTSSPEFGWIDELGEYPETKINFGNKTLEAHKFGAIIPISEEVLADAGYNLEGELQDIIVQGMAEYEAPAFLTGDGVKKPLGMTQSIKADMKKTTAVTDIVTLDDVENLFLSVPSKYRKKGSWIVSEKFYRAVFKLKDANGLNIFIQPVSDGGFSKLFGRPLEVDDSLSGASGEPLAFFGDIKAYKIADRGQMAVQKIQHYRPKTGEAGIKVYKRVDGKLALDDAIAQLNNK